MKGAVFTLALVGTVFCFTGLVSADETTPESSRDLVISEIMLQGCFGGATTCVNNAEIAFIEIYNNSDLPFNLTGWKVENVSSTYVTVRQLPGGGAIGEMDAFSYLSFGLNGITYSKTEGYFRIVNSAGQVVDIVGYGNPTKEFEYAKGKFPADYPRINRSIQRCETKDGYLISKGSNKEEFSDYLFTTRDGGVACPGGQEEETGDDVPQYCSVLQLSEISTNEQWIEIYNDSDFVILPVNLKNCFLSVQYGDKIIDGKPNYRKLNLGSFSGLSRIEEYEYFIISINETSLSLAKNVKDRSVVIHDNTDDYSDTLYSTQKAGTSLSYFADGWKITYHVTPRAENIYQQWQTCETGKHINEATGNCVKDPEPPAECAEGQFRNPETGRCKKIASEKELVECAVGQFRNPLTNRCKKIAVDDGLKPCAEGWERNPDTNRCRKIISSEPAQFSIDEMEGSDAENYWIWAGIGGLLAVGGVVLWQFRPEISKFFKKIFIKHK